MHRVGNRTLSSRGGGPRSNPLKDVRRIDNETSFLRSEIRDPSENYDTAIFLHLRLWRLKETRGKREKMTRGKFFPDRKLLHYGSLPRRPRQLEGREMSHDVVEDTDYPRASPNVSSRNSFSLCRVVEKEARERVVSVVAE